MTNNPYTPGAGYVPACLAGRDQLTEQVRNDIQSLSNGRPQRSIALYGLRGVGKTVMLNVFAEMADEYGVLYQHLEATDGKFMTERLIGCINALLRSMSLVESAKALIEKTKRLIQSFALTYDLKEIKLGLEPIQEPVGGIGIFVDDLMEIIVHLGKVAKSSDNAVCIFIDEAQFLDVDQVTGIVTAIHRCNQLRLPLMVVCAGLPKMIETFSKARSYTERLFRYEPVNNLNAETSVEAIRVPAESLGVSYSNEAVDMIIEETEGYPYFIQEMCSTIWDMLEDNETIVGAALVKKAMQQYLKIVDEGFYQVRYARCKPKEKEFMYAMIRSGESPYSFAAASEEAGYSNQQSASPVRATLISKGMIYAIERGKLAFTAPQFDNYLRRVNEYPN